MNYDRIRNRSTPNVDGVRTVTVNGSTSETRVSMPALKSEQTLDCVVPHFHARQKKGEIFNNPYFHQETQYIATDHVLYAAQYGGNTESFNHDRTLLTLLNYAAPEVTLATEDAALNAQIQAMSSVNATDVDVLAFAGEWSQTKRLHRDLGKALLEMFTKTPLVVRRKSRYKRTPMYDDRGNPMLNRKGEPRYRYLHDKRETGLTGETLSNRLSNVYLVGRMGILPLLSDLEGAVKVLSRIFDPRFTARGNVQIQGISNRMEHLSSGNYGTLDIAIQTVRTFDVRYGILYESDPYTRTLARLGLTRPLSSAWQLMPWSFVADWFLEVGKYLDAIQPAGFTKTLCAWGGTRDTTIVTQTPVNWVPIAGTASGDSWSTTYSGSLLKTTVVKQRFPWFPPAFPPHPSFGSGFSQSRSSDFAALVLQRIKAKF